MPAPNHTRCWPCVWVARSALEGERRALEQRKRQLDRGPDRDGEGDGADADGTAKGKAGAERAELEHGADETDAKRRPPRADDHQRVARAGSEVGAEVETRPCAHQRQPSREQRDTDAERFRGERGDPLQRAQHLDEAADEDGVGDGRDADARPEQPGDGDDEDADGDVGRAERERGVPGEALVEDVPRRQPETRLK